jgi:hypothetical protein
MKAAEASEAERIARAKAIEAEEAAKAVEAIATKLALAVKAVGAVAEKAASTVEAGLGLGPAAEVGAETDAGPTATPQPMRAVREECGGPDPEPVDKAAAVSEAVTIARPAAGVAFAAEGSADAAAEDRHRDRPAV